MNGPKLVPAQARSSKRLANSWGQESSARGRHTASKTDNRCVFKKVTHDSLKARVANNVFLRLLDTHPGDLQRPFPADANKKCWMPTCERLLESPEKLILHVVHDCSETNKGVVECRNPDCESYGGTHDFRRWPFSGTLMSSRHLRQAFSIRRKRPQSVPLELETTDIDFIQKPMMPTQRAFTASKKGSQQRKSAALELLGDLAPITITELPVSPVAAEMSSTPVDSWMPAPPQSFSQPRHPNQHLPAVDTMTAIQFGSGHTMQYGVYQGSNDFSSSYSASDASPQSLTSSVSSQMTQQTTPTTDSPSSQAFFQKPLSGAGYCEDALNLTNGQALPLQTQYISSLPSVDEAMRIPGTCEWPVCHAGYGTPDFMSHINKSHATLAETLPEYPAEQHNGDLVPLYPQAQLINGPEYVLPYRGSADAGCEMGGPWDKTPGQAQDDIYVPQNDQYVVPAETSQSSPTERPQPAIKMPVPQTQPHQTVKARFRGQNPDKCPWFGCKHRRAIGTSKKNWASHLKRHYKTHVGDRLKCPIDLCDKTFKGERTDNLRAHLIRKHKIIVPKASRKSRKSSTSSSGLEVASKGWGPASDQATVSTTITAATSTSMLPSMESGYEDPVALFTFTDSFGSGIASNHNLEMDDLLVIKEDDESLYAELASPHMLPTAAHNFYLS